MIRIARILCPVDFSDHSRKALDQAMAIARHCKASVTAFYAFAPMPIAPIGLGPVMSAPVVMTTVDRDQLLAETKAFVEAERAADVAVDTVIREGLPAAQILEHATAIAADLIVMGTHGRSGFERFYLGSVTEKVLRKASCPVMTVPVRQPDAVPAGAVLYPRILCPVDFSDTSWQALTYAIAMAQEGARLTVLHVSSPELEGLDKAGYMFDAGLTVAAFLQQREAEVRRRLQEAVAQANESCAAESLVTTGNAWQEILRVAAERQSDLIVMGVRGRGGADLAIFGSTAHRVLRQASCPVMTVRGT